MFRVTIISLVLLLTSVAIKPPAQSPVQSGGGVLRLLARVKVGDSPRRVARKRFFLIKGSLEQNKAIVQSIEQQNLTSRDCYYARAGASASLIKWLRDNDCETVYCREIQAEDIQGATAVPEFVKAVAEAEKQTRSAEVSRKWLTGNLPDNLRIGYYQMRQSGLHRILQEAKTSSGAEVLSVMTDRNGTAYFTELEPGTYTLSNILPIELGTNGAIWNCEVQVKPGDLASEKPFLISNRKDKNVKCVAVEKPLPTCEVQR